MLLSFPLGYKAYMKKERTELLLYEITRIMFS